MVVKVAKYIGSAIAKRVLKNNPQLHKKFDDIMQNEVDVTRSIESQTSQALQTACIRIVFECVLEHHPRVNKNTQQTRNNKIPHQKTF